MRSAYEIKDGTGKRAEYTYNAFGNRIGQDIYGFEADNGIPEAAGQKPQNPEQQIYYTLDLTRQYYNLLISEDKAGQKEQTFYWDGNVAAVTTNAAKAVMASKDATAANAAAEEGLDCYYLQDDLGSPMQLVDEEGEIRETYGFDEFGLDLGNLPERQMQPFGYTGYQMEAAGGLYFAQARRYDASAGRFISEDKISGNIVSPITLNRYGYCWNNPLVLIDLSGLEPTPFEEGDGLDPTPFEEGDEAHKLLQAYLTGKYVEVECEVPIPNSSINGNTGRADIVYTHNGILEIYEIKRGTCASPGSPRNIDAKNQLDRYINAYNDYHQYDIVQTHAVHGTSLNAEIEVVMLESKLHENTMIKYYIYPWDPGMIYWGYVKLQPEPETVTVPNTSFDEKDVTDAVITTGEVVVAGVVLYYAAKWIAAGLLAPYTAGGSVVAAACTP